MWAPVSETSCERAWCRLICSFHSSEAVDCDPRRIKPGATQLIFICEVIYQNLFTWNNNRDNFFDKFEFENESKNEASRKNKFDETDEQFAIRFWARIITNEGFKLEKFRMKLRSFQKWIFQILKIKLSRIVFIFVNLVVSLLLSKLTIRSVQLTSWIFIRINFHQIRKKHNRPE